ncbi:unnamed protein product, partial [Prorocentrum cordatum]
MFAPMPPLPGTAAAASGAGADAEGRRIRQKTGEAPTVELDDEELTDAEAGPAATGGAALTVPVGGRAKLPPPPQDPSQMALAQYIISAVTTSMSVKVDAVEAQVAALQATVNSSSASISSIQAEHRAQRARLDALEAASRAPSSNASTAAGRGVPLRPGLGSGQACQADPWGDYLRRGPSDQNQFVAPQAPRGGTNTKHVVFVAGFPGTWDKDEVEAHLRAKLSERASLESQGIAEIYGVGRFCDQAKVVFGSNRQMWNFMKAWKGRKIPCQGAKNDQLWHKVDQEPREVELSRRVSYAVRLLREYGEAKNLCTADSKMKTFDGDWDRGQVVFRRSGNERPIRILQRLRATDLMEICTEPLAKALLDQEPAEFKLPERLGEINDPPSFRARAMSLDLQLPVWGRARLITSHQFSHIVRCEYAEAIAQLRECLITMSIDCHAIVSVDAQGGLGIGDGETVGQYSATKMTWRGEMPFDLMTEVDLVATNTFSRARFTDAEQSDHLPMLLRCHASKAIPTTEPEQAIEGADLMERPPRKPVAWQLEDAYLFNETVCSTLQAPYSPTAVGGLAEGDLANALGIFTGGSARGRRCGKHLASCAGWSFAVYRATSPHDQDEPMVEACGPVVTHPQDGGLIQVIADSTCVQGLITEVFQPRENAPLATLAVHLWKRAAAYFDLHVCWVKGRSGNIGNEKADFWAKRGADWRFKTARWRRPCPAHDWGAEEYRQRVSEHKLAETRARKRRCSEISREDGGDTFAQLFNPQPRLAACSRQGTPSISALAMAISAGAAAAGRVPRRGRWRPPLGDPELLHLMRLGQLRAQESDLRARRLLGPAVATAERALRGRCNAVNLERLCARGRADRPYRSGKPVCELKTDDGQSANAAQARCELTRAFYANLFADPTSDQALPAWVYSQWAAEHQQAEAPLSLPLLKTVIGQLTSSKSCAESDMIVAGMIQGLQDDALEQILAAFRLRLCSHVSEYFDQAWTEHVVQLIRKKTEAQKVAEFRPIALASVLLKIRSMMALEVQRPILETDRSECQFAFRRSYQGDPAAPEFSSVFLDADLRKFQHLCRENGRACEDLALDTNRFMEELRQEVLALMTESIKRSASFCASLCAERVVAARRELQLRMAEERQELELRYSLPADAARDEAAAKRAQD